jgi:hypothetical protein
MTRRSCLLLGAVAGAATVGGPAAARAQDERSLQDAVAAFNERAQKNPVGPTRPPLTDEEVVAAIRGWIREQVQVTDEVFAVYERIADTGRLPKGAEIRFTTGWTGYRGYDFDVWWIDLDISTGPNTGYTYRIRDQNAGAAGE